MTAGRVQAIRELAHRVHVEAGESVHRSHELRQIAVEIAQLRKRWASLQQEYERLRTVAQDAYDAFAAWSETPAVALDDDTLDALSDLGVALASPEPRQEPER